MKAQVIFSRQRYLPSTMASMILLGVCCLGVQPLVSAAANQSDPPERVASTVSSASEAQSKILIQEVLHREWESDVGLAIKVSFSVQRQPLDEFLRQLQQQTGVDIELPEVSSLRQKRLTAAGTDMLLSEVLSCLNRLYAINWKKRPDGSYIAQEIRLNDLERELMKFGDPDSWRTPEASMSGANRRALARAIVEHSNEALITSSAGQPLTDMPVSLQGQIRKEIEQQAALNLVDTYARASIFSFAESLFRIQQNQRSKPSANMNLPGFVPQVQGQIKEATSIPFNVGLVDAKGDFVAPITTIEKPLAEVPNNAATKKP